VASYGRDSAVIGQPHQARQPGEQRDWTNQVSRSLAQTFPSMRIWRPSNSARSVSGTILSTPRWQPPLSPSARAPRTPVLLLLPPACLVLGWTYLVNDQNVCRRRLPAPSLGRISWPPTDVSPIFRTCTPWAGLVIYCLLVVRLIGVQKVRADRLRLNRSQWVWTIDANPPSWSKMASVGASKSHVRKPDNWATPVKHRNMCGSTIDRPRRHLWSQEPVGLVPEPVDIVPGRQGHLRELPEI